MRDDYQRLLDIHEGIERIERYTAGGRSEFDRNELVQTWVLHHLQMPTRANVHGKLRMARRLGSSQLQ
jgi:hypothetical protein